MDTSHAVVIVVECGDGEANKAGHEPDDLHPFAAVHFVIDQERGKIVADKRHTYVDQIPKPIRDYACGIRVQHGDELGLEELVAVEEDIIGELETSQYVEMYTFWRELGNAHPCDGCSSDTWAKIRECKGQRLNVIACYGALLLRSLELLGGRSHLVETVVHEPERANGWNDEGHAISPLRHSLRVRWVTTAGVEDE